ncbi:MAG TPA: six-cysteine peptide SCIFF [Firmicutes bacterium]|nr:six-cysteine peptide SCIFF [Bacillota bacterium]
MKQGHVRTLVGSLVDDFAPSCGKCHASCQSACKTSCTVGNQVCRRKEERIRRSTGRRSLAG